MTPHRMLLGMALTATLAAAFWPQPQEGVASTVAERDHHAHERSADKHSASTPTASDEVDTVRLSTLRPGESARLGSMRADLFPTQSWRPPPPPPPKYVPPPPPLPVAPSLQFQYLGRWKEDGKDVIFLAEGDRVLKAQVGDVLSGWHLDQASDNAIIFTWTALNLQQILRIAP